MRHYPLLTQAEQVGLPQLVTTPIALPSKFEDSTHQVFVCDTVDGRMVLKVCDQAGVDQSDFWQGLNHLFGADFPNSLGHIKHTHALLNNLGVYTVPDFVASKQNRFVLTRFVDGVDVDAEQVTDKMVLNLAKHVSLLHQYKQPTWGALHAPVYSASEWSKRLHATLAAMASKSVVTIPGALLEKTLQQVATQQHTEFVPLMLDLRWDQFRTAGNNGALALVDLDAFVMGPRALELVLLEYILTPAQFAIFKAEYTAANDWPVYEAQKSCYQLLLFLMQVLGEVDLAKWMRQG